MADEKLYLPKAYNADADPEDATARAARGRGKLVDGLRRLRKINSMKAELEGKRKQLMKELLPMMSRPITMLDPETGRPILAVGVQPTPLSVSVADLRLELFNHFYEYAVADQLREQNAHDEDAQNLAVDEYRREIADRVDIIVADVLKPPEVDTKEDGLFVTAVQNGVIPQEVAAKVIKENPSSAYIGFPNKQVNSKAKSGS